MSITERHPLVLRHRLWISVLFFALPFILGGPVAAELLVSDHHVDAIHGDEIRIALSALDAGQPATIEIAESPRHGTLSVDGEDFVYEANLAGAEPFFGVDTFTFFLDGGSDISPVARVTLRVLPEIQPLAGYWPTLTCHPGHCPPPADTCEQGWGAELGWYDTREGVFFLCDWTPGPEESSLQVCGRYRVPRELFRGGRAMVIDWDGDGWDEPAIHDPVTGDIFIFEDSGVPCADSCEGHCLERVAINRAKAPGDGHGGRLLPLTGVFNGLPPREAFSAYDPVLRQIGLGLVNSTYQESFDFTAAEPAVPVAGDWLMGGATFGFFDRFEGALEFLAGPSSAGLQALTLQISHHLKREGAPFAARKNGCSLSDLAFFDPANRKIQFFTVGGVGVAGRGGVRVTVPTDPAGFPAFEPNCEENQIGGSR